MTTQTELDALREQLAAMTAERDQLKSGVRAMASVLSNREWANTLSTNPDIQSLDVEISALVGHHQKAVEEHSKAIGERDKLQSRLDEIVKQEPAAFAFVDGRGYTNYGDLKDKELFGWVDARPLYALPADQSAEIGRLRVAIEGEAVKWDKAADFANTCGEMDKVGWTRATSERLRAMISPIDGSG